MDVSQLVLYAVASLLALKSLTSLMTDHKARFKRQLVAEELMRQKEAKKKIRAEQAQQAEDEKVAQEGRVAA